MRRMIVRLLIAKMIPVAFGYVKKAFSKKKLAVKQPNPNVRSNAEALNNDELKRLEDSA